MQHRGEGGWRAPKEWIRCCQLSKHSAGDRDAMRQSGMTKGSSGQEGVWGAERAILQERPWSKLLQELTWEPCKELLFSCISIDWHLGMSLRSWRRLIVFQTPTWESLGFTEIMKPRPMGVHTHAEFTVGFILASFYLVGVQEGLIK